MLYIWKGKNRPKIQQIVKKNQEQLNKNIEKEINNTRLFNEIEKQIKRIDNRIDINEEKAKNDKIQVMTINILQYQSKLFF